MQFNSYDFILIFFPLLFTGYFVLNKFSFTLGRFFLIVMGARFYTYYGFSSVPVLAASIIINYTAAALLVRNKRFSKPILIIGIVANVTLLFYFKYSPFILSNINSVLHTDYHLDIILPLGISFFTFQQISYILSVYKKQKNESLPDYLLYIFFFPKLIMGPLVEPEYLISQFHDETRRHICTENISCGLKLFCFGLFKKLILADTFALAVSWLFGNTYSASSSDVFLCSLAYTFEIYFDFSGYSDMAVGISQILNFDLPINFDSPYKAVSIRDFWKRWHISLTSFFTRNIYIPLGGSRKGTFFTYANVMAVFLISGIWHGANWTFILWGLLHGALSAAERVIEKHNIKVNDIVGWLYSFMCVNFLWLLFTSDSISQWKYLLYKLMHFESTAVSPDLIACFNIQESVLLLPVLRMTDVSGAMALLFYISAFFICLVPENNYRLKAKLTPVNSVLAVVAFFFAFIHLGGESIFVYFNF